MMQKNETRRAGQREVSDKKTRNSFEEIAGKRAQLEICLVNYMQIECQLNNSYYSMGWYF